MVAWAHPQRAHAGRGAFGCSSQRPVPHALSAGRTGFTPTPATAPLSWHPTINYYYCRGARQSSQPPKMKEGGGGIPVVVFCLHTSLWLALDDGKRKVVVESGLPSPRDGGEGNHHLGRPARCGRGCPARIVSIGAQEARHNGVRYYEEQMSCLAASWFADRTLFTPAVLGYPFFTWRSGVV